MEKFCFDLSELSEACLIRPLRQKFEKVSSLLISLQTLNYVCFMLQKQSQIGKKTRRPHNFLTTKFCPHTHSWWIKGNIHNTLRWVQSIRWRVIPGGEKLSQHHKELMRRKISSALTLILKVYIQTHRPSLPRENAKIKKVQRNPHPSAMLSVFLNLEGERNFK